MYANKFIKQNRWLLALLLFFVQAHNVFAADCAAQISEYGNGKGPNNIDRSCFEEIYSDKSTGFSGNSKQLIFYNKAMVCVHDQAQELFWLNSKKEQNRYDRNLSMIFAGSNFSEFQIKSVTVNSKDKELIIYDEQKNIFAFFSLTGGNISPIRKLQPSKDSQLNSMVYDSQNSLLWVSNAGGALHAYSTYSHYRNPTSVATTLPRQIISGNLTKLKSPAQMQSLPAQNEIAVYDNAASKIYMFSAKDDGNRAPIYELSHPELSGTIKAFIYVAEKNQFWIRLMNDKVITIDRK